MKRLTLLVILAVALTACGGSDELPPTPPPPGGKVTVGGAIAGMAAGMPSWAAPPRNIALTPKEAFYNDGVLVSVSDYDYIYSNAYIFNSQVRTWQKLVLEGEKTQEWISGQAIASINIDESTFAEGDNYVVVYACDKANGNWDCNAQKWMLATFTVQGEATGAIPELAQVDEFVINERIDPFVVEGTTAEKDNFGDVNVIRYDAKYKEPGGLTVLVHVFDFNDRSELDTTLQTFFKDIVNQGWKVHNGHNVALFLAETDNRITVWSSGKQLIYIETFASEAANKEMIEGYLAKYPSDLKKI